MAPTLALAEPPALLQLKKDVALLVHPCLEGAGGAGGSPGLWAAVRHSALPLGARMELRSVSSDAQPITMEMAFPGHAVQALC